MRKNDGVIILIFAAILLFSLIMILNQGTKITGYATQINTTSNVTISTYFAIDMSTNLSDGIQFGTISTLPTVNQNATHNYDGVNTTAQGSTLNGTNGTSMWMNVSTDSNTGVDFCVKADVLDTAGGDAIGLGNESYHNNTVTNVSLPALTSEVSMTTTYTKAGYNISQGSSNYYRFWLDVPAGTVSGTYNNTVSFKGVSTESACGT